MLLPVVPSLLTSMPTYISPTMAAAHWLVPPLPELVPTEPFSTSFGPFCLKWFRQQERAKVGDRQGCYHCPADRKLRQREAKPCLRARIWLTRSPTSGFSYPHCTLNTQRLFLNSYPRKEEGTQALIISVKLQLGGILTVHHCFSSPFCAFSLHSFTPQLAPLCSHILLPHLSIGPWMTGCADDWTDRCDIGCCNRQRPDSDHWSSDAAADCKNDAKQWANNCRHPKEDYIEKSFQS